MGTGREERSSFMLMKKCDCSIILLRRGEYFGENFLMSVIGREMEVELAGD